MKMETMSRNIVSICTELAKNEGIAMLLVNDVKTPFDTVLNPPVDKSKLVLTKIFPYPFDLEATVEDGSFIRVYYNDGEFNSNEVIAESQLNIDIVVSMSLWLIRDDISKKSLIRPYEIMGRVLDVIGRRSNNTTIKLNFDGYQHLYINPKFDAIRLYSNYMSIET